mmetsp:Transcript_49729/g.58028  ORF Transcript_49729/g.58028 Transcript_49729/m.58028 type:complete len:91 (+) Transcript_49729:368-640(+)|eukprot:CAMPEP_0194400866 /NCGR_PEP_ID=MMETSP0174-20130528/127480_1 /TAXON_ID=216777 /ORGANISM="Proboscia alata, Strain PI-D3" /LENGTH=90 /DNA_ID=CAMNT_0039197487 /DNA_START=1354 /DNA_END=1626 /DNA_ORIENTATION=-
MTVDQYKQQFDSLVEVVESCGAEIADESAIIKLELNVIIPRASVATCTQAQFDNAKEVAWGKALACQFIMWFDKGRCGSFKEKPWIDYLT